MPYFNWDDDDLKLDIPSMDNQHKALVEAMNRIFDLNESKAGGAEIEQAINHLRRLMVEHFRDEEAYMASIKFARLDIHRTIHKQLQSRLEDYITAYHHGDGTVSREFFQFLQVWLTSHIMGVDKEYSGAIHTEAQAAPRVRKF